MKLRISLLVFGLLSIAAPGLSADKITDGVYIGWKKHSFNTPRGASEVYYHEHKLVINGDKVKIDAVPAFVMNGKLTYSESDGGFYTYEGQIYYKNNEPVIKIKIVDCDYYPVPVDGKWSEELFPIILENDVTFVFDSVRYILLEIR